MSGADRRRWTRAPVIARCWCEDGEVTLYSTLGNLSEGGVFVRTFAPLPKGREARVRFQLSDGRKLEAGATVMWRRDAIAEGLPIGMGLQFTRIDPDSLRRIRLSLGSSMVGGL
jgi:uncharacterized protein (TIGR02266 family)